MYLIAGRRTRPARMFGGVRLSLHIGLWFLLPASTIAQSQNRAFKETHSLRARWELEDSLRNGTYEMATSNWIADFADPVNYVERFHTDINRGNYSFADVDELIDSAKALQQKFLSGGSPASSEDIEFVEHWLTGHIYGADMDLGAYLGEVM